MFYYPNVLLRHTGCFSTVWLAATKGIKVTRRELLRVNVKRTCGDILDYVTAQVPPPQPNLPKPRFSLYLSSQLQYGVVVVYHRQCGFLLEEIQQTIDRLLRSERCIYIDMAESDRLVLDVPDNLILMEEVEGAQDPFFGLMESHLLPSPYKIHLPVLVSEEEGSQHSLVPGPHTAADTEGFRSDPAAISLTEEERFVISAAEFFVGDDLPEATAREIEMLMDQPKHFIREEEPAVTRDPEGAMTSSDQLKETELGAEPDGVWRLHQESGHPAEPPLAADALEMTPPQVAMPTPPSGESGKEGDGATASPCEEVAAPPLKKPGGGRRRQLVFADPEVQIPEREMKEQILNPLAETRELSEVMLDFSRRATAAQLFSAPCGAITHPDILSLWKRCATITALPGHGGEEEEEEEEARAGESEQDREILRGERKRRHSGMREISSESGLQPAEGSSVLDVALDMSREDSSASDVITPASRWSPKEEAQLQMEPIAEENIEMPEAQTHTESSDLLSCIFSVLQRCGLVTFDSLAPPEAGRTAAAHSFSQLLELLSARQVTVQQAEPYRPITINTV